MWFYPAIEGLIPLDKSLVNKISSFCIDSRKAQKGSLFFALPGQKVDGHNYLNQAAKLGAVAAIVEKSREVQAPINLIRVDDVKKTLQQMAKLVIEFWKPKVVAITGSLGKTSAKEFTLALLKEKFSVYGTPGNYNSQLTLPLTILNAPSPTEYIVLEMGIDQPGEMDNLVKIAPPDYAILTHLSHVHVENFETFEHLISEKLKIFQNPKASLGLYSKDAPSQALIEKKILCEKISTSLKDPQATYYLNYQNDHFEIYKNQMPYLKAASPFFDLKSHWNLLLALALADRLGVDQASILKVIPTLKHEKNRLQKIEKGGVSFICDAYNANYESAENALESLKNEKGRKIAILSDMVEQGKYHLENHEKLATKALECADVIVGLGPGFECSRPIWKKSRKRWAFFLSYSNMLPYISKLIKKGDVILLKGSRKQALERVINDLSID